MKSKKFKCKFCKNKTKNHYIRNNYYFIIKTCDICDVKYTVHNRRTKYVLYEIQYYFNYNDKIYCFLYMLNNSAVLYGPALDHNQYLSYDEFKKIKSICHSLTNYNNLYGTMPYYNLFELGYNPKQIEKMFIKYMRLQSIL